MLHNSPKTILWLLALLFAVTGCRQEDIQFPEEPNVMGRIVLALSEPEVYVDAQTRAPQTLDAVFPNFVFTLNGTAVESGSVNKTIPFENGVAIIEAGTYTLTASTLAASQAGNGCPHYEGSAEFTLGVGETVSVRIGNEEHPLTPLNAKLTIVYDNDNDESDKDTFAELYGNGTFTVGTRTINLTSASTEAFFPAGTISYTIAVAALAGSHVTDISGAKGTITVEAGKAYTLTLKTNPVSGEIIPIIEGTHNSTFD